MKAAYADRERNRLREIARQLELDGYIVVVEPSSEQLPDELGRFHPDLIAMGPDENLVVEIKSRATLPGSAEMMPLAQAVQAMDGWRFELVVTNPRDPGPEPAGVRDLSLDELRDKLRHASQLATAGDFEPALLMAWAGAESALRRSVQESRQSPERQSPAYLVKRLFSDGVLSSADRRMFERALEARNQLAHGFWVAREDLEVTTELIGLAHRLLGLGAPEERS